MTLDFENFKKATDFVDVVMSIKGRTMNFRQEILSDMESVPEEMKLSYLSHMNTLFLNVIINRQSEFCVDAIDRAYNIRHIIGDIKTAIRNQPA